MDIEQIEVLRQVFQKMVQQFREWIEHITPIVRNAVRQIVSWYKPIKRNLLYIRSHGTQQQRRAVWKLLHPPQMRKVRTRVVHGH